MRLTVADLMALGLGLLRLDPQMFWRMTPKELKAAAAGVVLPVPPGLARTELEALIRQYPDDEDGGSR